MGIVGFSFSKFDCEKAPVNVTGGIEVKHNINILNVEKTSLNLGSGSNSNVLKITFGFDIIYGQEIGKICVKGEVIYTDTKEIIEETVKSWNADKKLNQTVSEAVFKFIYSKTAVRVLDLADALGLPSPIPLPNISFGQKKE